MKMWYTNSAILLFILTESAKDMFQTDSPYIFCLFRNIVTSRYAHK